MSSARQRLLYTAAVLAVSLHFALAYVSDAQPFLDLTAFAAGRAPLPFQSRALTAWLLWCAMRMHPGALHAGLLHLSLTPGMQGPPMATAVVFMLAFLSMVIALVSTRASLLLLTGNAAFASYGCFLVPYMAYFNYILSPDAHFLLPYDLPSLAFFCAGLYSILARRIGWYYLLFTLACLNRETAVFLVFFFAVLEGARLREAGNRGHRRLAAHLVAQLAVWAALRLWMRHIYGHNPVETGSGLFEVKLLQNLGFLLKPQHWPTLLSNFGFLLPVVLWYRRRIEHAGLQQCLPLLAVWFAVMMVAGVIIEIRIFGELISYMALMTGLLIWNRPSRSPAIAVPRGS